MRRPSCSISWPASGVLPPAALHPEEAARKEGRGGTDEMPSSIQSYVRTAGGASFEIGSRQEKTDGSVASEEAVADGDSVEAQSTPCAKVRICDCGE